MNIDIIPNGAINRVHVSQNDIGRTLTFELFNGSLAYDVPIGATVKIQGTKPSGFGFSETCTVSGNVATIDTTEAMTDEYGYIETELQITNSGDVLGTSNFVLAVERNPHPSNTTDGTQITAQSLQVQIDELSLEVADIETMKNNIAYQSKFIHRETYGYTDLDSQEIVNGWTRVVSNGIPIEYKSYGVTVTWRAYGTKDEILILRFENNAYVIKKVVSKDVVNNQVSSTHIEYDFIGDGTEYIAISGVYFNAVTRGNGYYQFNTTDYSDTDVSYPTMTHYTSAQMAYYFVLDCDNESIFAKKEDVPSKPLHGKNVLILGDSIMANGYIHNVIAEATGANVVNRGIGGSRLTYGSEEDIVCCGKIAQYLWNGNIDSIDVSGISDTKITPGGKSAFNALKTQDWVNTDIVLFSYGTNDYSADREINGTTYGDIGKITTTVDYIIKVFSTLYPHIKLAFFTPSYRNRLVSGDSNNSDVYVNAKGYMLKDYEDAIAEHCALKHIPCKEMYDVCQVNEYNQAYYLTDGLHRTEKGWTLLGNQYAQFLIAECNG